MAAANAELRPDPSFERTPSSRLRHLEAAAHVKRQALQGAQALQSGCNQGTMMSLRPTRKTKSITTKAAELAVAVPQVVAHRVARMAIAGPTLSERDRKEFNLMVAEKKTAFAQAWQAMATQTVHANQTLAASFFRSMWSPTGWGKPSVGNVAAQLHGAALVILDKGMAPVHRKAVANAKRLARTKLR
jgi:hypothetical protein